MSQADLPQIEVASLSDIGRQRSANQDRCDELTNSHGWRLLVVADGMGGHQGGETASRIAVEAIQEVFERDNPSPPELLREAFEIANRRIYEAASQNPELEGMGTTAVALLLDGTEAAWLAHVGDSRAYRLRDQILEPLTKDHSVVTRLVEEQGMTREEAQQSPNSHVLLRAVGVELEVEVDVKPVSLAPGDRFLLCSDGLWGEVPDAEIAATLRHHSPADAVRIFVAEANNRGGPDNVTVQVAALPEAPEIAMGAPEKEATSALNVPAPQANRRLIRTSVVAAIITVLLIVSLLWLLLDAQRSQSPTAPAAIGQTGPHPETPAESDTQP